MTGEWEQWWDERRHQTEGIKIQTKFFTDVGGPSGKKQQSVHSHLLHNSLGVGNIHL